MNDGKGFFVSAFEVLRDMGHDIVFLRLLVISDCIVRGDWKDTGGVSHGWMDFLILSVTYPRGGSKFMECFSE